MHITVLCNAGLALHHKGEVLLIDLPNQDLHPFYSLPDETWDAVVDRQMTYNGVCGIYFTHCHPDHYDPDRLAQFCGRYPHVPVFVPDYSLTCGELKMGSFEIAYSLVEHAPLPFALPPHAVTWVQAGDKSVYIAADAALDPEPHREFLKGRRADVAFWNAMYLSRPETRALMHETACRNYIYHMPLNTGDDGGIWSKCRSNLQRHGDELRDITVIDRYPYEI